MGIEVKKEDWIRRFLDAYKAQNISKNYSRGIRDRAFKNGNSREVLLRITKSGRARYG